MCRSFGTCLNDNDYLFPTLSQLEHVTNQQLKDIGLGYRDAVSYTHLRICSS